MGTKTLTIQRVTPYLKQCGYKSIQENYTYYSTNAKTEKTAELVAFHQPVPNSYSACIAVLDGNNFPTEQTSSLVLSHLSLGSPIVLVYKNNKLEFWQFEGAKPVLYEEAKADKLDRFFSKHSADFSPDNLCRAKAIGQGNRYYQQFMFVVEKKEGEYLSNLMLEILASIQKNIAGSIDGKWLFQAGFWLIGAKLLKDKKVEKFKRLDISNVDELVSKIKEHYSTDDPLDISSKSQKKALENAAKIVSQTPSLAHITTESLAYVYENTLVNKKTRQALGTHATPSWLVNYIVWQVSDWISEMPQDKRMIFEPACGHAPFLTAGAKLLSILYNGKETERHNYLKDHLIGIETDPFAAEIARLALTLADIPNKNGWKIINNDIYKDDILAKTAKKTTIFFCNPPFEKIDKNDKQIYKGLETTNKAAEVITKVLRNLPEKAVFGVVLPRGFLHKKNLSVLRKYILDSFELRTICSLPETGVFGESKHPATVLLGRKFEPKENISYIRVDKSRLELFKSTYSIQEEIISKNEFYAAEDVSYRVSELKEIWDYCKGYAKFRDIAEIGRGIEYKDFGNSIRKVEFRGAVKGFGRFEKKINNKKIDINIASIPDYFWMSTNAKDIKNLRYGKGLGIPQIIANYARTGGDAWRIKGLIDNEGLPVSNSFITIRPKSNTNISINVLWALVNSPFTNEFMFDICKERHNMEGILREMPIPEIDNTKKKIIDDLVSEYFEMFRSSAHNFFIPDQPEKAKNILLAIDAEILRLYDLPPRLEKRLLKIFEGVRRKGVDFKFDRYYEKSFGSNIPLHIYISQEFQNSTVENVMKWVDKNKTPAVIEALKKAKEGFEEE